MIYLACIVFFFSLLQLGVGVTNLLTAGISPAAASINGVKVSVLIPARNEEQNIANLLTDLREQDYRNLEILVFDDESTDSTAAIISHYASDDQRIRLISSKGLPEGWLGKNFACHSLSTEATGDYLLFLDADVRIGNGAIADTVSLAEEKKLDLLSVFPKQILVSAGEKSTVPVMNYILLSLLPLILVRKIPFQSLGAANGQFMLFRSDTYRAIQPHNHVKGSWVEDILIARLYKRLGARMATYVGNDSIRCRMYTGYQDAVSGFSRNIVYFFGNSHLLAVGFWFLTTLGFLIVGLYLPLTYFVVYMIVYLSTRLVISLAARESLLQNILFILPQQLAMGEMIFRSKRKKRKKSYTWKGRNIY